VPFAKEGLLDSIIMSTSNEELLPFSPYIGIRPPTDTANRDRSKVVYGFPLSDEWLRHRYHYEVELKAPASEGASVETRSAYLTKFAWHLSGMCQKIHPVKCTTTIVQTGGYSNGQAMFLIVGYPGRKPPPETLKVLIDKLASYGIVEHPGWYPRA